nr:hypothetical protein [Tanacetum cinerariifolium]
MMVMIVNNNFHLSINRSRVTIRTMMYPEIHLPSQETSDEVFQANNSIQNKESFENSFDEIAVSNPSQEEPLQESSIHQLIEECSTKISEKQKMEDTMLDALNSKLLLINSQRLDKKDQEVKNVIEQPVERGNRSIQSLQNFSVIHKSSISLNTSQISSIHAVKPILSTKEHEHLLSMGYEHLSITPETKLDEVTESNAENLLPIASECEVTLEDKRKFYDDDFEDIEYVEASFSDPEIVSVEEENGIEEENDVHQEEEYIDLEDISQIQDVVLRGKLLSITRLITNIESLNDNPTPDHVFNSFESDNSLLDNFSPEFKTFCDHSEEMRSGEINNLVKSNILDNSSSDPRLEEADLFLFDNSIPPGIENFADDPEGDIRFLE